MLLVLLTRGNLNLLLLTQQQILQLFKIKQGSQYNYEKLLAMYNDALQGKARYIGTLMSGTPQS
ncbi:MAG: BREX system ATP-binding domain-containing protein, partial [Candidatus Saccharibacteria bacterium]